MISAVQSLIDRKLEAQLPDELWQRLRTIEAGQNEYGFDPFGFDPDFLRYVGPPAYWMYRKYFRAETTDIENIPDSGTRDAHRESLRSGGDRWVRVG